MLNVFVCRLEPYKPCSLTDEERIEKCKKLKELEEAKNAIINRDDLFGDEKILEHITVHEVSKVLGKQYKYIKVNNLSVVTDQIAWAKTC